MSISTTIQEITKTIPRLGKQYAETRSRQAALAPYADATALLAALDAKSGLTHAERGAIILGLASEHQARGGELCQSILLAAFEPALVTVRKRLGMLGDEDLDQDVLVSFLEALGSKSVVAAREFAPVAIIGLTKRSVFKKVRLERGGPTTESYDDEGHSKEVADSERVRSEAAEAIEAILGDSSDPVRDVLTATVAGDESLTDYVARCMPDAGADARAVVYERLRQQRYLALVRLRAMAKRGELDAVLARSA